MVIKQAINILKEMLFASQLEDTSLKIQEAVIETVQPICRGTYMEPILRAFMES